MERKIGEIFEYNGEWLQCVEQPEKYDKTVCAICDFHDIGNCKLDKCGGTYRSDKKSVIFKKLEKVGEPFTCYIHADERLVWMQEYKLYDANFCKGNDLLMYVSDYKHKRIEIEIKQNKEDMEDKKQTSLNSTKDIYEKFRGKTVQCLVNNKDGDLVNGYGIVCGYTDKYLIIGFTNGYEGCIKSFTDNVFLENRDFLSYRFWNISHVDDKPFIKPFNLEAARSGKPVCTRDGRKARIICFDRKFYHDGYNYPIVAMVNDNDNELVHAYTHDGLLVGNMEGELDLMMLPEKKEGWVNVYRDCDGANITKDDKIYSSKDAAIVSAQIIDRDNYVATTIIKW